MLEAASAIAQGRDALEKCAEELRDRGDQFICFATAPLQPQFERGLRAFGGPVFGCSGYGVISGNREIENEPAAVALALRGCDSEPFVDTLEDSGSRAGYGLAQRWPSDAVTALLFPDVSSFDANAFFREFQRTHGFAPLIGGISAGQPQASIFCGDHVAAGKLSSLIIRGAITCDIVVTQCCEPLSDILPIAASENNVIHKLGSEPALNVLKSSLKASSAGSEAARTGNVFAGMLMDDKKAEPGRGDFLIRTLVGADQESGTISIGAPAHVGQKFAFLYRNSDVSSADLAARLTTVKEQIGDQPIVFGLYFNCAGRGTSLYGRKNVDIEMIRHHLGDFPLVGFNCNGEIAPVGRKNILHNFTGVLALFRQS